MKKSAKLSLRILALTTVSLVSYQNCAPGALNTTSSTSSASTASFSDCGTSVCDVVDTSTVAFANSQNVLQAMVTKAGITTPSTATKNAFTNQASKLPETGNVAQITAPMMMAVATMGSEVCNDLINQEMATGATRRIFNSLDFTRGPASVTDTAKADAVRRLARNFWSRNETAQELTLIKSSLNTTFTSATAADTKKEALYLCTAMIASTDAQKY